MICQADIKELWDLRDPDKALLLVKHEYQTKQTEKYLGNINENYPRKIGQVLCYGTAATLNIKF